MFLFDYSILDKDICKNKTIVIYGCGVRGVEAKHVLSRLGYRIPFFIQTNTTTNTTDGIPVYSVRSLVNDNECGRCVLICVDDEISAYNMENELCNNNINNYFKLIDYRFDRLSLCGAYSGIDSNNITEYFERWKLIDGTIFSVINTTDIKKIALVVMFISPRLLKILQGFRSYGFSVHCFIIKDCPYVMDLLCDIEDQADFSYVFSSISEIMEILVGAPYYLVYLLTWPYYEALAVSSVIISMKGLIGRLFYEEYDVAALLANADDNILSLEKYCVENADYVCDRAYEIEYLTEKAGVLLSGKRIQLLDGCSDLDIPVCDHNYSDELSIVYSGTVFTEKQFPNDPAVCWMKLAQICKKSRCHLHIYVSDQYDQNFKERYADYIQESKDNEYFHMHHSIRYDLLIDELSKYDYGINPESRDRRNENNLDGFNKYEKIEYLSANKLFDYIDAGIPMVGTFPKRLMSFFDSEGIAKVSYIEDWDFIELKNKRETYRKKIKELKKKLSMTNQIRKILDIIENK